MVAVSLRGGAAAEAISRLNTVMDPEVPVLSIVELGIVRSVDASGASVTVTITPTYSGCPAMRVIEEEIVAALRAGGFEQVEIKTVYAPAWTTDWMSDSAREKLRAYGIAPPGPTSAEQLVPLGRTVKSVACPFCGSVNTTLQSEFGPTACKSLHACHGCRQPFEQFKAF
ncbi:MAG: phenylacetate-CoA oxygenase subunit PaaJ [Gemmatimonadales bacterium]|nr:phenylacetate-CoA oxygenase subunit PaaJ [Gemmatimonadales bacterium]